MSYVCKPDEVVILHIEADRKTKVLEERDCVVFPNVMCS